MFPALINPFYSTTTTTTTIRENALPSESR